MIDVSSLFGQMSRKKCSLSGGTRVLKSKIFEIRLTIGPVDFTRSTKRQCTRPLGPLLSQV